MHIINLQNKLITLICANLFKDRITSTIHQCYVLCTYFLEAENGISPDAFLLRMTTGVAAVKSVCVGCMLLEFAFVLIWLLLLYWLTVLMLLAWLVLDFPSVLLLHLVTLLAMVLITPELIKVKQIKMYFPNYR